MLYRNKQDFKKMESTLNDLAKRTGDKTLLLKIKQLSGGDYA